MLTRAGFWYVTRWLTAALLFAISMAVAAEPNTLLKGSVLDAKGKPLAGVPVGIYLSEQVEALRKTQPQLPLATRTDAAGRFQLSLPQSLGQVGVVAYRSGLATADTSAKLDAQQRELPPLRLSVGLTLDGHVSDEAGRALMAAKISGDGWPVTQSTVGPLKSFSAQSRADGSFVITGLKPGAYLLRAELTGHGIWSKRYVYIDAKDPKSRTLNILLRPEAYLVGVVTDPGGRPLAGAKLSEPDENPRIVTLTDGAGRFRLGPYSLDGDAPVIVSYTGYTTRRQMFKAPQNDLQLVLSRDGVLRGRVIDVANGKPVNELGIAIQEKGQDFARNFTPRTVTARDGRFELTNVAAGPVAITALARGYIPAEIQGIEIIAGEVTPEVLIELQRGIVLRGRVLDKTSGKPLQGAIISYGDQDNPDVRLRQIDRSAYLTATSDDRGSFALEGLPPGTMTINAESFDHAATSRRMVLTQDSSVELRLSRGASIAGQVLAADGVTPVEAWMTFVTERGMGISISTDQQGHFELNKQAAGRYRISAANKTQATQSKEVVVTEDQRVDGIKLVLQAAPVIRGAITGLSPQELTQLVISDFQARRHPDGVRWWWPSSLFQQSSRVEIDGTRYRLDPFGSAPGETIVIAGPAQGPQVHKRITLPERGDVTVDFDFAGGMQVTGKVTAAGKPAAGISMWATPDEGQPVAGVTQTSASGEYRFADLGRGIYRIGPANVKAMRLQMTGNVVQDFELPALEVAGSVSEATSGRPLSGALVEIRAAEADAMTERRFARTDRDGNFKLDQLAPGDYVLTTQRAGYDMARQEITLRSSLDSLSLPLRAADGVRLRVLGPDLGEISMVTLTERVRTAVVAVVSVSLDITGAGKIPPSLTGRTFTVEAIGFEPFNVNQWSGDPLDVTLRKTKRQ